VTQDGDRKRDVTSIDRINPVDRTDRISKMRRRLKR
jgi:hypothetical protein